MLSTIERLKDELPTLRRNRLGGQVRPHKLVMLLAALEMAEDGMLKDNRIYADDTLIARFEQIFMPGETIYANPPLLYSNFGRAAFGSTSPSVAARTPTPHFDVRWRAGAIRETIEHHYLDEEVYELIQDPAGRRDLMQYIHKLLQEER